MRRVKTVMGCLGWLIVIPYLLLHDLWQGILHGSRCPACYGIKIENTEVAGVFRRCHLCNGRGRLRCD